MKAIRKNINELNRQSWLKHRLAALPSGARLLDAGAGQLQNKIHCAHLNYVSQDFCQYSGSDDISRDDLHIADWDILKKIDIVSDITSIPVEDASFDAILCSEVLEHVPDPILTLSEFKRILKPGGIVILTAPFSSNMHMAPYHFYTGFTKYWYSHHLEKNGFAIITLEPSGDWFSLLCQELSRLGALERKSRSWIWPLAYFYMLLGKVYFYIRPRHKAADLACFGWNCVAMKLEQ